MSVRAWPFLGSSQAGHAPIPTPVMLRYVMPGLEVLYEKYDLRRYQSGQPTVFSGTYIVTVLQYV